MKRRITYNRVTVGDRVIWLRGMEEINMLGEECVTGRQVTVNGDAMNKVHVIALSAISAIHAATMNNRYGSLDVGKESYRG